MILMSFLRASRVSRPPGRSANPPARFMASKTVVRWFSGYEPGRFTAPPIVYLLLLASAEPETGPLGLFWFRPSVATHKRNGTANSADKCFQIIGVSPYAN